MRRRLILSLAITLVTLSIPAVAQDISSGLNFLPNKTVANHMYSDCEVSDLMHTFHNLRDSQCDLFSTFRNGEIRLLKKEAVNTLLPMSESTTMEAFGETACLAVGNATWIRNFTSTEDLMSWYVAWDLTWFPRKADNTLDVTNKKEFKWNKCRVYKSVASTGCINFDEGRCDTGAPKTPVVIDLNNDSIVEMTSLAGGVKFDLDMNSEPEQRPWLANGDDGWLVFDSDANGIITGGHQLFGPGDKDNGYLHLAGWDDNGDRLISARDGIWPSLAIWRDLNHNGVSESGELLYLTHSGIESLSLEFKESRRKDRHGNEFRYRAKLKFLDGREGSTFDVILTRE